jgi:hypothetical protein
METANVSITSPVDASRIDKIPFIVDADGEAPESLIFHLYSASAVYHVADVGITWFDVVVL